MKFKVGDKVKVIRRSIVGEIYWNPLMDKTIGKTYIILKIKKGSFLSGSLRLSTKADISFNFYYPPLGVEKIILKNQQLLFSFMEDKD